MDLVIGGHSHIYERFQSVVPTTSPDTWPITHITTGGGGAPLYTTMPHPALASQVATNHFLVIEATPTKLKGRAFTTNNTLIDSFEMKKSRGRAAVMAKAKPYSEELLNLAFDVAPVFDGGARRSTKRFARESDVHHQTVGESERTR